MNERAEETPASGEPGNGIAPLPGEAGIPSVAVRRRSSMSLKALLTAGVLGLIVVGLVAMAWQRFAPGGRTTDEPDAGLMAGKPTAAAAEPRRLEMPALPPSMTASPATGAAVSPRVPAPQPLPDESAEPIGVRRTGTGGTPAPSAEDAPVVLVTTRPTAATPSRASTRSTSPHSAPMGNTPAGSDDAAAGEEDPSDPMAATRRNLQDYQRQLQGVLGTLTRSAALATGQATPPPSGALLNAPAPATAAMGAAGSLFGGQLQGSSTPTALASRLVDRSLTLPKGAAFTCALKTKVISATSGLVGCLVQRHVYSDDGKVLLIERGSHLDGEYRITSVRPGMVRIPVLWTRVRTPLGVTVDLDSPGTGALGESGIDGYVDNRWGERLGAAMLLSLIDDSVKLVIQNQTQDVQADTVVLPSTTSNTSKLAEKVLDSTINIPPLIYQNQGGIVGIYVARDVDFSSVYELQPTPAPDPAGDKP